MRYIRHALAHDPQPALDYVLLTHFHDDHMGGPSDKSPAASSGAYKLTGVTQVGESLKIGKLLDRGWPDYSYPQPLEDAATKNYRAFVKWQTEHNGLKVERFAPGRNDQVVLCRDAKKYPDFEFRNVGANGEIWTGEGTSTRNHFPPLDTVPRADWPHENMCSISFRLSYGKFDYFNGGDIPGIPPEGRPAVARRRDPGGQGGGAGGSGHPEPPRLRRHAERVLRRHVASARVDALGVGCASSHAGRVASAAVDPASIRARATSSPPTCIPATDRPSAASTSWPATPATSSCGSRPAATVFAW